MKLPKARVETKKTTKVLKKGVLDVSREALIDILRKAGYDIDGDIECETTVIDYDYKDYGGTGLDTKHRVEKTFSELSGITIRWEVEEVKFDAVE